MTFEAWYKQKYPNGITGLSLADVARAAWEAGRSASRRPVAIIQRAGNNFMIFQQRYNADRTERSDFFIRGGFASHYEAREWARSNGYEVEA